MDTPRRRMPVSLSVVVPTKMGDITVRVDYDADPDSQSTTHDDAITAVDELHRSLQWRLGEPRPPQATPCTERSTRSVRMQGAVGAALAMMAAVVIFFMAWFSTRLLFSFVG